MIEFIKKKKKGMAKHWWSCNFVVFVIVVAIDRMNNAFDLIESCRSNLYVVRIKIVSENRLIICFFFCLFLKSSRY